MASLHTGTRVVSRRESAKNNKSLWRVVAAVEVVLAVAAVLLDLLIPSLVLVALAIVSLIVRRQGVSTLGLRRPAQPLRMAAEIFGLCIVWSILILAVYMPLLEHLTGQREDVSQFVRLEGNLSLLLFMLLLTWTVAAFGEEFAFRGYLQTRIRDVLPSGLTSVIIAVLVSSVLFGFIHTEQGVIGILLKTLDGIFFSLLRYRYQTLWGAILGHGFINTIGLVAYFIAGPFYGLW